MIEQQLNDETRSTFLQMGLISYRVTLHKAWKACKEHTLQLIGPIRKLRRKSIIMNTDRVLLTFRMSYERTGYFKRSLWKTGRSFMNLKSSARPGKPYWRGRLSTVDLLILSSLKSALFMFRFFTLNKLPLWGGQQYWAIPLS